MKTITFKLPTINEVDFSIEATPETIPVRGNYMASGDDAYDKKAEDKIIKRAYNNIWAWCTVTVVASFNGVASEPNYLGFCTYKSKKDFIKNSGYYEDMRQESYDNLIQKLESFEK